MLFLFVVFLKYLYKKKEASNTSVQYEAVKMYARVFRHCRVCFSVVFNLNFTRKLAKKQRKIKPEPELLNF